uniref:Uncharacterized protein n=1 Tax=Siphoviridae sp. ctTC45 TaxID=2827573 RepID=A0A8S5LQB1_9CAUD|nr:MAG TPA: hypothetical protein [Siphoviridae sp. ctTC45]DAV23222.1 MAG TPA: hypothetical protein [Caudoviricetes sp.]
MVSQGSDCISQQKYNYVCIFAKPCQSLGVKTMSCDLT